MYKPEVVVIDYGAGNLLSVQRGLEYCGAKVTVACTPEVILSGRRVVLPGVGAFANAMVRLEKLNLVSAIQEIASRGTPLLGICLGMQLLLDQSEEFGESAGLGLIPGQVLAIPDQSISQEKMKIPHIGWNGLVATKQDIWQGTLLANNKPGDAMYFVHSYMAIPALPSHRLADSSYGGHSISAVISKGNITGCQFHPEKSGELGLKILSRFVQQ